MPTVTNMSFSDVNMGAVSTLFAKIDVDDTTLVLSPGTGPKFTVPASSYFWLTIRDNTSMERVLVTQIVGDRLSIIRGQCGTNPADFRAGSCVSVEWTGAAIRALIANETGTAADGVTGTVATPFVGQYENGRLIQATPSGGC